MTLILEDGTGVANANSYITPALITSYLTDRSRQTENGWNTKAAPVKDGAAIQATDFIEQRFALRFLGRKEFPNVSAARATLTFTGQPVNAETVTLDTTVYTFNTTLGGVNSVLIGANVAASILNLVNAIKASTDAAGVTHGGGTVAHTTVDADEGIGDTLIAVSKAKGTPGNTIVSTVSLALATWSSATLLGGSDVAIPQSLSFPRLDLLNREGGFVRGMPAKLLAASAEYAVRSLLGPLMPDPTIDASGRTIVRKKEIIGPIETDLSFEPGGALSQILKPYPAADRLLAEYLRIGGRVIRG